mgnify:CR=1 FL=1
MMINNKTTMKLYNESYSQQSNKFVPYIIWDNNTISKPNNQKQVYEATPTPKQVEVPIWDNLPPLVSPITIPTQEKPKTNSNPWNTNKNNTKKSFAEILYLSPNFFNNSIKFFFHPLILVLIF